MLIPYFLDSCGCYRWSDNVIVIILTTLVSYSFKGAIYVVNTKHLRLLFLLMKFITVLSGVKNAEMNSIPNGLFTLHTALKLFKPQVPDQ